MDQLVNKILAHVLLAAADTCSKVLKLAERLRP